MALGSCDGGFEFRSEGDCFSRFMCYFVKKTEEIGLLIVWVGFGEFNGQTRCNVLVWEDELALLLKKQETQLGESIPS